MRYTAAVLMCLLSITATFTDASRALATDASQATPAPAASYTPLPGAPPGSLVLLVTQGTRIPVAVTDTISSATAQVGDIVNIVAAEDVVVNGYVVIAKGAGGQAEIASVEQAHGNGGSGKLGIKMDWISAVDGEKIRLSSTPRRASEEDRSGGSSTATILSYALLGPIGLFFHNFAHGKNVVVTPKKVLSAFVDTDVHITASTKEVDNGFAH